MNWIKNRYDQFLLALTAVILLAFAILVILKVGSFGDKFSSVTTDIPPNDKIPPLTLEKVDKAKEALEKPPFWVIDTKNPATRGSLFVSEPYYIGPEGTPKKTTDGSKPDSYGKPIPNIWFTENGFSPLQANIHLQDPDKDGFLNEDEYRGSTDPNNKDSHPPYHTKLFFKQFSPVQFRLIFKQYNGDPKKPQSLDFQIDTLDLKQPTSFLKLGEIVPKTKFKLDKFEFKEAKNDKTGEMDDVSELTVVNTETSEVVLLVMNKVVNSPDVFGIFDYQWPQPTQDIRVKKLQEFALRPDTDKRYKLVDINETQAVIQLPDGSKYTVLPDPRKSAK